VQPVSNAIADDVNKKRQVLELEMDVSKKVLCKRVIY
jgi:hypothetical protein